MSFSYKDYISMYKARGWYLPYKYFFENHLFDIKRGIDTHVSLQKNDFEILENLKHGVHYACSWESTVKKSSYKALQILIDDLKNFAFIDIGCGKGKVSIIWNEIANDQKISLDIYGIDYSKLLVDIAKKNHLKLFGNEGQFFCEDITSINFKKIKKNKLLIYLYNPFDEVLFKKLLDKLKYFFVCIIYVYPIYEKVLIKYNYNLAYKCNGKHPNETFSIYIKDH